LKAQPDKRISRDEIREVYRQGEDAVIALVEGLLERIESLETRLSDVEAQLKKTSRNSHKSPSSDGVKKRTKSLRTKSHRASGGQPKHKGTTLEWSETVDEIVMHSAQTCHGCGISLETVSGFTTDARQIHDIPPLSLQVIEHHIDRKDCPHCGLVNHGTFPSEAKVSIQYGPQLKGLMVYLMEGQLLPSKRVQDLLRDVYGCELSEGSLYLNRKTCFERLESVEAQIKTCLIQEKVAHFDETGLRVSGKPHWLHVSSNSALTYYFIHPKRGREAMDAMGVLPLFDGISVHDGLSSYRQYDSCHALCNAHHLRELQGVVELYGQHWAEKMSTLLVQIHRCVKRAKKYGNDKLTSLDIARFTGRYCTLISSGLRINRPPPIDYTRPKKKGRHPWGFDELERRQVFEISRWAEQNADATLILIPTEMQRYL